MLYRMDVLLPDLTDDSQTAAFEAQLGGSLLTSVQQLMQDATFGAVFSRLDKPLALDESSVYAEEDLRYAKEQGLSSEFVEIASLQEQPADAFIVSQPDLHDGHPAFARGGALVRDVLTTVQSGERPVAVALATSTPVRDVFLAMEAAGLALPEEVISRLYGSSAGSDR